MTLDPLLDLRRMVETLKSQEQHRDRYIREAFDPSRRRELGYTVDDIAEVAGLSRQRIYQIAQEKD